MKLYTTSGSMDFMEFLRNKYTNERMVVMHGVGNSVVLHETESKSVFQTPLSYEVIGSENPLKEEGFFAFNYMPVTDEGRPLFEHWTLRHIDSVSSQHGFIAYRILRPTKGDHYAILTQWTGRFFYEEWQRTPSYKTLMATEVKGTGLEAQPHLFTSAPYISTYKVKTDEE